MKNLTQLSILLLILIPGLWSCDKDDDSLGQVNITIAANSAFKAANTDPIGTTRVVWGCLVLSETKTACIYYYNGEAQTDGNMSTDAIDAGPGTSGFTFVESGTEFRALEGGNRIYSHFFADYDNNTGSPIGTPIELNGEFDLYANVGEDVDWIVEFGSGAKPTVDNK